MHFFGNGTFQKRRLFGQGTKVAVEIAVMALDSGLIPYGVPVISVGGTNKGADTALLLVPSHAATFFDTRIQEVISRTLAYPFRHRVAGALPGPTPHEHLGRPSACPTN